MMLTNQEPPAKSHRDPRPCARRRYWPVHGIQCVSLLLLCVSVAGCAAPGYWRCRAKDAADIVSFSIGEGLGAKARIGPANVGLFFGYDQRGLRGGELSGWFSDPGGSADLTLTLVSAESFAQGNRELQLRNKDFTAVGCLGLTVAENADGFLSASVIPYYTQMEFVVGVKKSIRIGVNPGEFLDFVLGWACIDIFDDDRRKCLPDGIADEEDGCPD